MKRHLHLKAAGVAVVLIGATLGGAWADGIVKPVYLGNPAPKTDVLGRILPGSWLGDPAAAARVEIRQTRTNNAVILPPDPATGEGNETFNPLLLVSRMGENVIGTDPGQFSVTLTNRFPTTNSYYVRVYDKSTPSASLYYANSAVFQDVPPEQQNQESTIDVVFQGWQLVNGEEDVDSDGDGIPDAMELDMSFDSNDADMDDDGYDDLFEVLHSDYLHAKEGDPNEIQIQAQMVNWWAVPAVGYRLEYTDAMLVPEAFVEIWSGTATQTNLEVNVEAWVTNGGKGFFRWVVP